MAALLLAAAMTWGCTDGPVGQPGHDAGPDAAVCDPEDFEDRDDDGIWDGYEGCAEERDTDGDGVPDCADFDSDNDHVSDEQEAFTDDLCAPPVDTDGDGLPNFVDPDSDDDGVFDGDEGYFPMGMCEIQCDPGQPGDCAPDQFCNPAWGFCVDELCLRGALDILSTDTDGDGLADLDEPVMICRPEREGYPEFPTRQRFQSLYSLGQSFALPENATRRYHDADPSRSLCSFELGSGAQTTAGLLLSRPREAADATAEAAALVDSLAQLPGAQIVTAEEGTAHTSWHGYPSILNRRLILSLGQSTDLATARDLLLARWSGIPLEQLPDRAPELGLTADAFMVGLLVSHRETDVCDPDAPETAVVVASVAPLDAYDSSARVRSTLADLTDGSALIRAWQAGLDPGCEVHPPTDSVVLTSVPISQSVAVAVQRTGPLGPYSEELLRDGPAGFVYDATTASVHLVGQQGLDPIDVVVVSLTRWYETLLPCD